MGKFITIKDVAAKAGTSCCTVSYVLSGKKGRYISAETRKKVEDAARDLNYVKSRSASSLKGERTMSIAVIVPQFDNQFFTRIIGEAEKVLVSNGYSLIIYNTLDNPEYEYEKLNDALQHRVDGVIIAPTEEGSRGLSLLDSCSVPYIVVDRKIQHAKPYSYILSSNYESGKLAAERLLEMGHTSIGYIGWKGCNDCLLDRCRAVLDVYDGKGSVAIEDFPLSFADGYKATESMLKEHPDITALIFAFNLQGGGGVKYLMDKGISVPDNLSVVVIGTPQWSYIGNNFDRVFIGEREMGAKAAQMLLSLIDDSDLVMQSLQECHLEHGFSVKAR